MRSTSRFVKVLAATSVLALALGIGAGASTASTLTSASVGLSDSRPSQANVTYTLTASGVTTSTVKCLKVRVNTSATGGGSVPAGVDTTAAAFSGSSNYVPTSASWTTDASVNGTVTITDAGGETPASASGRTIVLTDITNGSTVDTTYFVLVNTYNNTNCSAAAVDSVVVAYEYTSGQLVSVTVDPTLAFTVAGTSSGTACNGTTSNVTTTSTGVDLGHPTLSTNSIGVQNLSVSTNGGSGYTVYTHYTAKPTFNSATIADHSGTNAAPSAFPGAGTEAFGYTTSDATLGTATVDRFTNGGPNWAKFTTGNAEVAFSNGPVSAQSTCMGYQVGIAGSTPAGAYTTTVVYTATSTF